MPIREHLYKAKRKDNGDWVKGYYAECDERAFIMPIPDCDTSKYMLILFLLGEFYEVDPETVCEYTGLADKNGKQIFEGDIVEGYGYKLTVVYDEDTAMYFLDSPDIGLNFFDTHPTDYEIIGNIYDNPEPPKGVEQ